MCPTVLTEFWCGTYRLVFLSGKYFALSKTCCSNPLAIWNLWIYLFTYLPVFVEKLKYLSFLCSFLVVGGSFHPSNHHLNRFILTRVAAVLTSIPSDFRHSAGYTLTWSKRWQLCVFMSCEWRDDEVHIHTQAEHIHTYYQKVQSHKTQNHYSVHFRYEWWHILVYVHHVKCIEIFELLLGRVILRSKLVVCFAIQVNCFVLPTTICHWHRKKKNINCKK